MLSKTDPFPVVSAVGGAKATATVQLYGDLSLSPVFPFKLHLPPLYNLSHLHVRQIHVILFLKMEQRKELSSQKRVGKC